MPIRWALADQALVSAGSFAFAIALVRLLGIDAFGAYTLVWGAVQLFIAIQGSLFLAPFQSLGHTLEQRYGDAYLYAVFAQQQLFSTVAAVCMVVGLSFFAAVAPGGLLPFQLAAGGATYFLLTQEYLRRLQLAMGQAPRAILGDAFRYGGPIVMLLAVTANSPVTLGDVFLMVALASVITLASNLKYYRFLSGHGRPVFKDVLRDHWPFVRWLTPSIAFQWINANLVFYAVGWDYGEGQVGALRMAQILSLLFLLLLEALENVVPGQAVVRLKFGSRADMERYIVRIGLWLGFAFVVFLGIVLPWTGFWLNVLYGEKAASVTPELVWMFCLVPALVVPTYCVNVLYRSIGATRAIFMGDMLASVISLLGALIVTRTGAHAAIVTILSAQAFRLMVLTWSYRHVHGHETPKDITKAV